MAANRILIVEDEKELADILGTYLQVEGFDVLISYDGEAGYQQFLQEQPELALLDIMLPKMDGMKLCQAIREISEIPIIMVSAKSSEIDKVVALGIGADDYVTKPYSPLELVARVKAQLRRYQKSNNSVVAQTNEIRLGALVLNEASYTILIDDQEINFTTKEFEILVYFAKNQNLVLTKEQIYQNVWGYTDCFDENSVTVYIKRIREKLGTYHLDYIKTVWGVGYKCVVS